MDISSLTSINGLTSLTGASNMSELSKKEISEIYSAYNDTLSSLTSVSDKNNEEFSSILDSMMSGLSQTDSLQHQAEAAEIQFALGESDNTHDLLIAQTKANTALQYTVAVRDRMIEAYREIMQMQI